MLSKRRFRLLTFWLIILLLIFTAFLIAFIVFDSAPSTLHFPILAAALVVITLFGAILSQYYIPKAAPRRQSQMPLIAPIELPYIEAQQGTTFAPARWSSDNRERGVKTALTQLRNQSADFLAECTFLRENATPDEVFQSAFDYEIDLLVRRLSSELQRFETLLRDYRKLAQDYTGDDLNQLNIRGFFDTEKAVRTLREKYQIKIAYQPQRRSPRNATEREFMTVFFNKTANERESMIASLIRERNCTRDEAMQVLVDNLRIASRSWR